MNTKTTLIIITSTIIAVLLTLYFYGVIKIERFDKLTLSGGKLIPISVNLKPKVALSLSIGGIAAMSIHHGIFSSIFQKKRLVDRTAKYSRLFKNIKYISAGSGGSWYASQLLYNQQFNDIINSIGIINRETVGNKWLEAYVNDFVSRRTNLPQDQQIVSAITRNLPFVIGIILKIFIQSTTDLNMINSITPAFGNVLFGSSIDNKKMIDMLNEYKHIIFSANIAILNNGILNSPTLSMNPIEEKITYSLEQKEMTRFPCRPGIPSSVDRLYDGTLMTNSTGEAFNSIRREILSVNPPNPLFDNFLLDTCKWIPEYDNDWLFPDPTGNSVYRCKNVSAADCCMPTGGRRYKGTCVGKLATFSSNNLPFIQDSVLGSNYMSGKIQYNIYNIKTESAPTGEWPNNNGPIRNPDSNRSTAVVDITSNLRSKTTNHLFIKDVVTTSGTAYGNFNSICYLKHLLYRSGVSEQEEWMNYLFDLVNVIVAAPRLNINKQLTLDTLLCKNDRKAYCNINNLSKKDKMEFILKNKSLNVIDAGWNGDTYSVVTTLLQYEHDLSSNPSTYPPNIITSVKYDSSETTSDTFKVYFLDSPKYQGYNTNDILLKGAVQTLNELTDTINQVANWGILIESGVILATVFVNTTVAILLHNLIPYFGFSLSIVLVSLTTEVSVFLLDLDIDDHIRIEDESNLIVHNYTIFNRKYNEHSFTTKYLIVSPSLKIQVKLYKNIPVIASPDVGLKGGYTIPNLYIIESSTDVSIFPFIGGNADDYKNLTADVFTGLNTLYDRHQEVRDMFNLLM